MNKEIEVIEKVVRLSNKINQTNKKPQDYGSGHNLYHSEIHTIEAINNHSNVNASELSKILGITNGAVNQVTNKLIKKGLIEQYKLNDNNKEVFYRLTDLGEKANLGHSNYHKEVYEKIVQYLNNSSKDEIKTINTFLDSLIENWPIE
ncbi:MarR family transcriptional regulator [Clostridium sp.]|uniref:MarR family winged helix-turn-helix transcriptional regulator n=1 Tax=Clostridium sp. TaxID=1506 RepID=UPI00261BF142|nr:MarR family transcriptional regulator [Clostridium sp.]